MNKPRRKNLTELKAVEEEEDELDEEDEGDNEEEEEYVDEEDDMSFIPEPQFQVQIFVTPGKTGTTEIRVSGGGVPRPVINRRLPPIGNNHPQGSQKWSSKSDLSSVRTRSRSNCYTTSQLLDGNSKRSQTRSIRSSDTSLNTIQNLNIPNPSVLPEPQIKNEVTTGTASMNVPTVEQMEKYLRGHPEFLERYVIEEVDLEQLERWIIRKSQRNKMKTDPLKSTTRKTSLSRWKFCVHADKRQMLLDLTQSLQQKPTKDRVLWELANCISSACGADGFNLYLPENDSPGNLVHYLGPEEQIGDLLSNITTIPCYVAKSKELVRISRSMVDSRFPDGISNNLDMSHILCQPIIQPDGQLAAVLELWRKDPHQPFYEEDEEIGTSYLVWGGIALHYAQLYLTMSKQKELNEFLLAVVKSIFQDMVSMDMLVMKIMNFAQGLVNADRASLFLVDSKNKELYATIFDVGVEEGEEQEQNDQQQQQQQHIKVNTSKEIRIPLGTGIAGQVAMTGEILNISDAYSDPRFNRSVDQLTGYRTETILCMPIFIRGSVIGVVQMVNKRVGHFTTEDEAAFEMFAVYCGLALHHAKLYDKIRRSEQKYKVALEVLSYHNTCNESELDQALKEGVPECVLNIDDYYFNPFEIDDYEKARQALYMFSDLFGLTRFDKNNLIRFMLTVKKNYRRVPYHNWTHGFSVSNSMYTVIKHCETTFRPNECLALYIGALCHDLDHRGKNNKFMLDTESPLAAIYSTSTMEHHHFNQTVTILQQEGHNIFSKLSSNEYKHVLGLIKHCILATDLALFFPNKARVSQLLNENSFSWANQEHRLLVMAITMTGSDLCASAKPWEIQSETVRIIFEEFYEQGDAERRAGRTPIPMMDRYRTDEQAASQVGFLNGICVPCYTLLMNFLPETKPLLDMCEENLHRWQAIDVERKQNRM